MEKRNFNAGNEVNGCCFVRFDIVAAIAGVSEILFNGLAASAGRKNVFYFKITGGKLIRRFAIFTTMPARSAISLRSLTGIFLSGIREGSLNAKLFHQISDFDAP
jgi:hypothetical protein